ncbi:MAG: pyruvate carboxylase [Candidatus Schekmanbacteria bacterium]|nr:pyruvate carboxylase [Candidatus Schekmanbacteria bacterium]
MKKNHKIKKIKKILIANRGEIAIRVHRACAELGIATIGIYSHHDRLSLHRHKVDEAYLVGEGLNPVKAYLDIEGILNLAKKYGADAIHPGYGFLSEIPQFAKRCKEEGVIFIGPSHKVIAQMGDKTAAKRCAKNAGLPMVPGTEKAVSLDEAQTWCEKHGWPVIIKASFGGGGRGMRIVREPSELKDLYLQAQREAQAAFGCGDIFLEKVIENAKHIEVQIMGDHYGNVVHLYERDCSIQRRHQKVLEMAPCLLISPQVREKICRYAVTLAKSIDYQNAGTVEFLVDKDWNPYFIEVNTRIQVEHTITEMITGVDLVKTQIMVAAGYPLNSKEVNLPNQGAVAMRGYSIQCRLTTEDPENKFIPDHGRIEFYQSPAGFGIRLDAGSAFVGGMITPYYDSLLVKVTSLSLDFEDAVHKMLRAIKEFRVRGVKTNLAFMENVLTNETFLAGKCTTSFIDTHPDLFQFKPSRDKSSHLLEYISEITINGNPIVPKPDRERKFRDIKVPEPNPGYRIVKGSREIFRELGAEGFSRWIREQKRLLITDTTMRDAHQSLLATRTRTHDMLAVAEVFGHDNPGLFSIEMWGGATFDAPLRFLRECPWERLIQLREKIPHILFQMLLRGANAVGYTSYPDNVVREFVKLSAQYGIDVFRIFDSLNWDENMAVALEAVRDSGMLAEAAICYTGDILDERRQKYNLRYYVDLAKRLEKMGANILCIKDMAGLCKPYAAEKLVRTLREEISLPIHFHTHDSSGVQAASILKAAEAGVDIVDAAISSMSGLTSSPNLNSIVAAMQHTERDTELSLEDLNKYADYWEIVREYYYPFESGLLASSAEIYQHEIPGGQYTNLWPQAQSMGLTDRWGELKKMYASVNQLLGDIVKVTPSSKIVGDMALYLLTNNIKPEEVLQKAPNIDFPDSVIGFFKGDLGQPPGGFPPELQQAVLKGEKPLTERPGKSLKPVDLEAAKAELERKLQRKAPDYDIISYLLYPKVFLEYAKQHSHYGDVSLLPTEIFLYGLNIGQEVSLEFAPGKTIEIKLLGISKPKEDGTRTLFYEVNSEPRNITVEDKALFVKTRKNPKADPDNPCHVSSPMPGMVVEICVKPGDPVVKGDKLLAIEAMKLEASVCSNVDGVVERIVVEKNTQVETGDLILEFKSCT